jgi:hypothetical protein
MANQITVNSGTGNITVTTSRAVIGTVANVASANYANFAGEAFDVSGSNVTGAVANATFATTAGTANNATTANTATSAITAATVTTAAQPNITSVGNLTSLNVTNTITTGNLVVLGNLQVGNLVANSANYANFAGEAFNVAAANVTGAVANATFATSAGSANTANSATVANSANSVTLANVSGAGNIASINLDGSTSNVLYGNGIFAPAAGGNTANANYANFAGNAFSVDGGNVVGAVANATFALDAGNANIANIAYSVDAANVSGLGNIATINLDGNASNFLDGTGNFVAAPGGANANYANFAGDVVNSAQANITSVGNLTSFTVNDGINGNTLQYNPAGITVGNVVYAEVQYSNTLTARDAYILGNTINNPFYLKDWISGDGNTILSLPSATMTVSAGEAGVGNIAATGEFTFSYYTNDSNLTSGATTTKTNFSMGQVLNFVQSMPTGGNVGTISTFSYGGTADPASSTLMRSVRRRGNSATRLSLEPNDYLGNIEWRGARGGGALPTGLRYAKIAPRVDSSYVANSSTQPVGIEFWVTDNSTARSQVFHANGNVTFNNAVNANIMTANYLYGDGSNISNIGGTPNGIQNGNSIVNFSGPDGDLNISTVNITNGVVVSGRQINLNGVGEQPPSNGVYSQLNVLNGGVSVSQDNIGGGLGTFSMNQWENTTSYLNPYAFFRARGNSSSPQPVANGDAVMTQSFIVYGDSGNTYVPIGNFGAYVVSNDNAGNVSGSINIGTNNNDDGSSVQLYSDIIQLDGNAQVDISAANIILDGNVSTPYDINVNNSNVIIGANGRLDYLRTFGSFTSNATQTSNGANTTNYMTLNNTEDANGISIASSTQITVARTGRYNIQFSAQVEKTDGGTDIIEIWLDKNGTAVANTATQLELQGSGAKAVAAWDFNVNAANVNDYFRLAWASPDTAVQLTAIDTANTISGVAIPSVIVDINPIGA